MDRAEIIREKNKSARSPVVLIIGGFFISKKVNVQNREIYFQYNVEQIDFPPRSTSNRSIDRNLSAEMIRSKRSILFLLYVAMLF